MIFLEFNLTNEKKITVNVSRISNIFSVSETECKIDMGNDDCFSVKHSYNDVIMMIQYFEEVKFANC